MGSGQGLAEIEQALRLGEEPTAFGQRWILSAQGLHVGLQFPASTHIVVVSGINLL